MNPMLLVVAWLWWLPTTTLAAIAADTRYYALEIEYERALQLLAPEFESSFRASIMRRAVEWCQVARLHFGAQPGNLGSLTERERAVWREWGCDHHFCKRRNATACELTAYGREVTERMRAPAPRYDDCSSSETRLSVLTTMAHVIPPAKGHPRYHEILLALGENARNPSIEAIVVIVDAVPAINPSSVDRDLQASRLLRTAITIAQRRHARRLDSRATQADLSKLCARVFDRQPTYADMIRFANVNLTTRLVALANADVVLRTINRIDAAAFDASPPLVLVLAIQAPRGNFNRSCPNRDAAAENRCHRWRFAGTSWDVHVFKPPVPNAARYDLLETPRAVYMNHDGAENVAGVFFAASGFELRHPCLSLLAEHWHCLGANKTHRDARVDARVRFMPGWKVPPSAGGRGIRQDCGS